MRYVPTWFPGAEFRRIGAHGTNMGKKIRFEPFEFVENRVVSRMNMVDSHVNHDCRRKGKRMIQWCPDFFKTLPSLEIM